MEQLLDSSKGWRISSILSDNCAIHTLTQGKHKVDVLISWGSINVLSDEPMTREMKNKTKELLHIILNK